MLGFEELLDSDEIADWQVCLAVVARVGGAGRGALGAGKRSFMHASYGLGRVWVEVMRVIDVGGTTGSSAGISRFLVHRKSLAEVFCCTGISYYVVCRPHVSQEIMSGVVCGW